VKLNESLIPGQGRGLAGGATYQFTDETADAGRTHYYWLEDIDLDGNVVYREMRSVAVTTYIPDEGRTYGMRLPFVWR
jgi:hypothetical protein